MRGTSTLRAAMPVFGVMFITIVGSGIFALPIALAPLGPRTAVTVVVVGGLFNMVTISALALAFARSSAMVGSNGRMATIVARRLGGRTGLLTAIVIGIMMFAMEVVSVLGVSGSLASEFGGSKEFYAIILLAIVALVVVSRRRTRLFAAATATTIVSISLLTILMLMLVPHVSTDLLTAPPLPNVSLRTSLVAAFGTVVYAYFAHATVPSIAPESLRIDPSGKSLLLGCLLAMGCGTIVHSTWTLLTLGSVPADVYAAQGSTGVTVLAEVLGPVGRYLALLDIVIALGMGALIYGVILGDIAVERLPTFRRVSLDFHRGVALEATDGPAEPQQVTISLCLSADGTELVARARRGTATASETVPLGSWDAETLIARVGGVRRRRWLHVTSHRVEGRTIRVDAVSTMSLVAIEPDAPGTHTLLDPDEAVARVFAALTRRPSTIDDLVERMDLHPEVISAALRTLTSQGSVTLHDGVYTAQLGHRHPSRRSIVTALAEQYAEAPSVSLPGRAPSWLDSPLVQRLVEPLPLLGVLLVLLYLFAAQTSFTTVISLIGIGTDVFVAVTLPLLLAIGSSRNRDTVGPRTMWVPWVPILWGLLILVTLVVAIYGLFIYSQPLDRLVALASCAIAVYAIASALNRRFTSPSAVMVIEMGREGNLSVRLLDAGAPVPVTGPTHLPLAGHIATFTCEAGITGPLRLIATSGDAPPPELSWFRATWEGGTASVDAVPDLAGVSFPVEGRSGALRVEAGVV